MTGHLSTPADRPAPRVADPAADAAGAPEALAAPVRGPLRRFLEARGTLGRHHAPHRRRRLHAADGVWLSAVSLPGPARWRDPATVPAVVLLHGFAASAAKPAYARLADELSRDLAVLSVDLRGHGRSAGSSTLGDAERHDVAAAVAALRADGHRHVTALGVSMGSTAAVHAAATGVDVDALVLVSGPGWFDEEPATEPLRQLHRHWHSPWSRLVMRRALHVDVAPPATWSEPRHPADVLPADLPTLVVHGRDDSYFPVGHGEALARGDRAVLWVEPVFGHAEDGLTPEFCHRLADAITSAAEAGGFVEAAGGPSSAPPGDAVAPPATWPPRTEVA
ncbi:alpha/beta hydrolase [Salsipaludibacter albus]|uniref:alpha/beta hydrolase n=1 Tax=Salsipaludibacter albus TaxID=2849650 RepID=UPI001EE3E090|nr:alpha/beta fold hydrolase [Salsipaludibacter albus]MBY5161120.1 alpha/beta hydrolase [Salsipaludibacter albus]